MALKRRKISQKELEKNTSQFSNKTAPHKTFTVVPKPLPSRASATPVSQPMAPAFQEVQGNDHKQDEPEPDFSEDTQTQRTKLLAEYGEIFEPAAQLLMAKEADLLIGMCCICNQADCQPLHWAHVWDPEPGYFKRQDISTILGSDASAIPLGHDGDKCPRAPKPLFMTIVDHTTGVHATKVTFCGCSDSSKWQQLMNANLFPATVAEPQTAFTFGTLRNWQLITLQSKITAYDYVRALRRLTDNVFTGNVPDVYRQFLFVTRIWPLLEAEKRFGRLHGNGMNEMYPRRPKDNLMVYCLTCPEPEVNMETDWENTPWELRHLITIFDTVDGNFKTGNYNKHNDPNDVSLFAGQAYMPDQKHHEHYLKTVPQIQQNKATCNHLKVENGANHAKFKNMSVTGNVNVQCSHLFVCSSVNMKGGEK
ncbi:hypothetical protein GGU11DRAFT_750096 [Lentinula aff. detonsa]|nr:hypothetical protein GGU11DRAFT_750096 [Lentinula aff. detonsa]